MKEAPKSHTIRMSVDKWIQLPSHPKQRPTRAHAKKVLAKNFSELLDIHRYVAACLLPDGTLHKADGHTRAFLWDTEALPRPDGRLEVRVHVCNDAAEANKVYDCYDNKDAAESTADRLGGALQYHGIYIPVAAVTSALTSALQIVAGAAPIMSAVAAWADEIRLAARVDEEEPNRRGRQPLGIHLLAAMLLTFRYHGERALPYWKLYRGNVGADICGKRCPVKEMLARRSTRGWGSGGAVQRRHAVEDALGTFERWIQNPNGRNQHFTSPLSMEDYKQGIKTVITAAMRKAEEKQRRNGHPGPIL